MCFSVREDLDSEQYRDIEGRCRSAMADTVLLEQGIADLATFHKVQWDKK